MHTDITILTAFLLFCLQKSTVYFITVVPNVSNSLALTIRNQVVGQFRTRITNRSIVAIR